MNSYQFDSLKFATEGLTGYGSTVIMDNANLPSFMKPINQITNAQLFAGGSSKVAEAFNVDGVLYKRFFISNFLNTIVNGRAYSWPGVDPRASINFDDSVKACNAKGTGFHLMSIPERAVINHLIYKSGFVPRGNTQYGKNHAYTYETGETTATESDGSGGTRTTRTATGSGPATWFHDGTRQGIADWVGNCWKWCSGMRVKNGEIQIFAGNLAAKQVSHADASTFWKAIKPDGSLVEPGTAGTLKYTKDFKIATDTGAAGSTYSPNFGNIAAGTGVTTIPEILKELFLAPVTGVTHTGGFWINNEGERLPLVGGSYYYTSNAGPSALGLNNERSSVGTNRGFFSAYMEL